MYTDLKHLYKTLTLNLSPSQIRLLKAIGKEPTAHVFSRSYMIRHHLTSGGVRSGIVRLVGLKLIDRENGVWQVQPTEMKLWLGEVLKNGSIAAESLRWVILQRISTG
jgi:hypothetical protein